MRPGGQHAADRFPGPGRLPGRVARWQWLIGHALAELRRDKWDGSLVGLAEINSTPEEGMKRLVVLSLLLTFAACATPPPPPAATAPPPQVAAAPPPAPAPMPPPPPTTRTSFDGLYKGSFVAEPYGGGTETLTGGNCDPELPINMRVKRGDVRIWYKDYRGHHCITAAGSIPTARWRRRIRTKAAAAPSWLSRSAMVRRPGTCSAAAAITR